jgi:hypothetical protein
MSESVWPDGPIPLAAEQDGYLGLGRDGHGAVPLCFRVRARLQAPALERALAQVMVRHEPLRLRLVDTESGLRQVFPPAGPADYAVREITVPPGSTDLEVALDLATTPSDVRAHGPVRTWLIRSGPDDTTLLVLIDHLATDGWGATVFARELLAFYYAAVTGTEPPPLPTVPRYSEFAAAQHTGAPTWTPVQYKYWRRVIRDYCAPAGRVPPPAELGSPAQPARSDLVSRLDPEQLAGLTGFARASRVPTRTVELASLLLAIWAWCPAQAIRVWCTHSGREDHAIANVVGKYSRSIPLVVRVDPGASLADFCRDVLRGWSEAVAYSGVPFSSSGMRDLITQAGGPDPAIPEVTLNRVISPGTGTADLVEYCDLTAARWDWFREPRLRVMSTFDSALSMRAVFHPGIVPAAFAQAVMANLDRLLPLFVPEHAADPIGDLAGRLSLPTTGRRLAR